MLSHRAFLAKFVFPLNAYALAVASEDGTVNSLHYGLDWSSGPVGPAQDRATDSFLKRLPAPPNAVLEIGVGLGTLANRLKNLGYTYTGISSDPAQIDYARRRYPALEFMRMAYEDVHGDRLFDVLLFQESAQYIRAGEIFRVARDILRPTGCMLIDDEIPAVHVPSFEKLAKDFGFALTGIDDLSDRAPSSLDYLIEALFRHRATILSELSLPSQQFTALLYSLEQRRLAYQTKAYRYLALRFDRIQCRQGKAVPAGG